MYDQGPFNPYGLPALAELFKQGQKLYPIGDEPTPRKPSLFKRLIELVKSDTITSDRDNCDEEMSTQTSS